MGEAKRRRADLRDSFLQDLDRWSFPATEWERALALELGRLALLRVPRAPDWWLRQTRMVPQECHANAGFLAAGGPDYEHVTGWWPQDGDFVLHSVVRHRGRLLCVTPLHSAGWRAPAHVDFIPDPRIEWRREGAANVAYRDGVAIGPGVRTDPAETMRKAALVRGRLMAGVHPFQAVLLTVPDAPAPT